ncbi:MAG: chromate transporter [Bacilli bacterium]|nr:chromate transporter [Bacilli bacterium]MDD3121743.1 chromate transporter [Bacilli bacterium]MDD4063671.1 chromate transporter [Bacilli bacterium]MDD4482535.1 chromate transporter [Bacilli bacterium]MDD5183474.1 chromate transporter [Bacilli bacterium]
MNILNLLLMMWTFFKIGLFTIGGGYAMIPMIEEQAIAHGWITELELLDFLAVSESTPGPFAVNIATFIGFSQEGIIGAIFTTIAVITPSFIIILLIAKFLTSFADNKTVQGILSGIKPIVVGLLIGVVLNLIFKGITTDSFDINNFSLQQIDFRVIIIIVIILTISRIFKKINPIFLILISGALGYLFYGLLGFMF